MADNETYVNLQEDVCSDLFKEFNNQVHWFTDMKRLKNKSIIDYVCKDKKGRKCHVELKERKANIKSFSTIFLDITKMAEWTKLIDEKAYKNDDQRLYINFMNDGIIIHNMDKISEMKFYPKHEQKNYAKGTVEHRDKWGLKLEDAIIYRFKYEDGMLYRTDK